MNILQRIKRAYEYDKQEALKERKLAEQKEYEELQEIFNKPRAKYESNYVFGSLVSSNSDYTSQIQKQQETETNLSLATTLYEMINS
jgi:phage terminase large subunit